MVVRANGNGGDEWHQFHSISLDIPNHHGREA
jgi:hypothetical protein